MVTKASNSLGTPPAPTVSGGPGIGTGPVAAFVSHSTPLVLAPVKTSTARGLAWGTVKGAPNAPYTVATLVVIPLRREAAWGAETRPNPDPVVRLP